MEKYNNFLVKNLYKSVFYTLVILFIGLHSLAFILSPILGQDDLSPIIALLIIIIFLLIFFAISFMEVLRAIEKKENTY